MTRSGPSTSAPAAPAREAALRLRLEAARAQLAEQLRGRRWLSEPDAEASRFELEDLACLDPAPADPARPAELADPAEPAEPAELALAILRFPRSGKRYLVPLRISGSPGEPTVEEASYEPELLAALVGLMRDRRTLRTEHQHAIELRAVAPLDELAAARAQPSWATPFQAGLSSNCLSELRHGAARSVCKLYKRLGPDTGDELGAMEALAGTGVVPELLGAMIYHGPHGREQLGMLSSLVEGELIYLPLSRHLKALGAEVVRAPEDAAAAIEQDLTALESMSQGVGASLLHFHQRLNARASTGRRAAEARPQFQFSTFLGVHLERWQRLHARVVEDRVLPAALATAVRAQLERVAAQVLSPAHLQQLPAIPATIPHGDLHLSHVLVIAGPPVAATAEPPAAADPICFLDVSPRTLDEHAPAFLTQTAQQDVLSLERSIQYFCFDEIMDAIKDVLGVSQLEATRRVLEHPEQLPPSCHALLRVLSRWSQGISAAIERGYRRGRHRDDVLDLPAACTQLFYICRLMHELEYNYSHDREFFKYCDFYYLLQLKLS